MQKILVIEDEEFIRANIADLLSLEGFEVIEAENGLVGLETAQKQLPDLILCDVLMPKMDGFEVLKNLRENALTINIPFIFLTARAEKKDNRHGMELGADDYLTKPFTITELLNAIKVRLERQRVLQTFGLKELEADFDQAMTENQFQLYYQPQIDIETGTIVGAEALIRRIHPQKGLIPPAEFIPLMEKSGLIVPLGEWVIRTACQQAKAWQNAGYQPFSIAVNLSGYQLEQPDLCRKIVRILEETQLDPSYLELELTETAVIKDVQASIDSLRKLKKLGIKLTLDDFGTGYSSLNYLRQFPFDCLKIDRSFVKEVLLDNSKSIINTYVIELAHRLNLKVVAEGVETADELLFLRQHACDEAQGYFFGHPQPPCDFEKQLQKDFSSRLIVNEKNCYLRLNAG